MRAAAADDDFAERSAASLTRFMLPPVCLQLLLKHPHLALTVHIDLIELPPCSTASCKVATIASCSLFHSGTFSESALRSG